MITTFAGSGVIGSTDGPANTASFQYSAGVAVDNDGNVFVADSYNNLLRKIMPQGVAATLAGRLAASSAQDRSGSAVTFRRPATPSISDSRCRQGEP